MGFVRRKRLFGGKLSLIGGFPLRKIGADTEKNKLAGALICRPEFLVLSDAF